jgi:Transposase domain (DUF772)
MERWKPRVAQSEREQRLLKLAGKSRKLFAFLREYRHELFDDAFQAELEEMYRQTGQGQSPRPPAMMCMGLLLQAYLQTSDAEAVRLSATDRCWQAVLGTIEEEEGQTAFSQGGLQQFRERLMATEMDRRLLERTVELAKRTKGFDPKRTPKTLRVGVDSRPLEGAGRVEDTINLLGHAGRKIAESVALVLPLCQGSCRIEFEEQVTQGATSREFDDELHRGIQRADGASVDDTAIHERSTIGVRDGRVEVTVVEVEGGETNDCDKVEREEVVSG